MRSSLRGVVQDRMNAGLTQRELAKRAGFAWRLRADSKQASTCLGADAQKLDRALGKG